MTAGKPKAAVMGLGVMGSGMARQLLAHGFEVAVYNRNPAKAAALGEAGARVAGSPAEAVEGAAHVVAMLADDGASRALWLGEGGALAAMAPGSIAIESSTLTPDWVRELGAAAQARGIGFIDAPVTGSRVQAEGGELRFLAGGGADDLAKAKPVLDAMGGETVHLGPVGSGALTKLINNFLAGVQAATLAEALAMAERSGLDPARTIQVLSNGAPGSPMVKGIGPRMLERAYTPNFFPGLMAKDLAYAAETFARAGIELKTAAAARERFLAAVEAGYGEQDIATVVEPLRRSH